jgi:hypothetical protein
MSGCCSNRRQNIQLQHARADGNMSVCNMLQQAATCPVATCGCNIMMHFVTTSHFYSLLDVILIAMPQFKIFMAVGDNAKKLQTLYVTSLKKCKRYR